MKTFKDFVSEASGLKLWKDAVKKEYGDKVVFIKTKKTDKYSSARDEAYVGDLIVAYREKDGKQFIIPRKKNQ